MAKRPITLGCICKDTISGFKGVAIACTSWINGCVRWTISPQGLTKDGAPRDYLSFDVEQIEYVGPGVLGPSIIHGGPKPSIMRAHDPTSRRSV
jgi:hypothetical protein